MHPFPLKFDQVQNMLSKVADRFDYELTEKLLADDGFFIWCGDKSPSNNGFRK